MKTFATLSTLLTIAVTGAGNAVAGTVFAVDAQTQMIVRLDSATGAALGEVPTPGLASGGPDGLAASGSSLFFVNAIGSNVIHEVDANSGTDVDAFPAPLMAGGTDGLAYMDGFLYTLDGAADTIFKIDHVTGNVVSTCTTGMYAVGGLAAEDGRLFAVLGLTSVVEVDPETCAVLGGPFAAPGGDFVLGLAFDGTHLFASTFINPAVFVMDPETGAVLDSFQPGFTASGLAASSEVSAGSANVAVDFMPNSCANALNVSARARVTVVVVGSDELDVGRIDVTSVTLEGLEPLRSVYRDRAAPDRCRGLTDGVLDLVLVFDSQAVMNALAAREAPVHHGAAATVHLQGAMHDGTLFAGEDKASFKGNPTGNGNGFGSGTGRSLSARRN
jgi:hypothetical protein